MCVPVNARFNPRAHTAMELPSWHHLGLANGPIILPHVVLSTVTKAADVGAVIAGRAKLNHALAVGLPHVTTTSNIGMPKCKDCHLTGFKVKVQ